MRLPLVKFVIRRLLLGIATLFIVSVLIFVLTKAMRGDTASIVLGREATPEALKELRSEFGLDRPIITQYTNWIGGVVTGDLGKSFTTRDSVWAALSSRVGSSLFLLLCIENLTPGG